MKTVEAAITRFTSPAIIDYLKAVLRERDKEFPPVEEKYLRAAETISKRIPEEAAKNLITAWDQQILSDLIYAAYLGFQANLSNYHDPVCNHFIGLDSEIILREHIMRTMPHREKAEKTARQYMDSFRSILAEYEDDIRSYYVYLEITGPKLAHYWGYCFANLFLVWVEPGYVSDRAQTSLYALELHRELGFVLD